MDPPTLQADRDTGRKLLDATYEGMVVDRNDPERIGRIRVLVPGVFEPASDWIRPRGTFGGSKNRGIWAVPKVGANVEVELLHGDPDYPRYDAGPWGRPGGVSDVPTQAEGGDPDIVVMRFGNFAMIYDERTGVEKLTILDVIKNTSLKFDGTTGEATLFSATKAILEGALIEVGLGATEAAVLGTAFALLYNAHTQPVTMAGAGPPNVPMAAGVHTSVVTTIK